MRALLVLIHRWAGLGTALFLAVAGITGSALAFRDELEEMLNPHLFVVPVDSAGPHAFADPLVLREQLARHFPQARADHVSFPRLGKSSKFFLMPRTDPANGQPIPLEVNEAFLNPYTGELLGTRNWGELIEHGRFHRENIVPFLWRLHAAFALPHPWGQWFMGIVALLWTVDCFVGAMLTLPRGRPFFNKWRIAWRIKLPASSYRMNLDAHRAASLWLWVPLLLFAWSSVLLNLGDQVYRPVMAVVLDFDERPRNAPTARKLPEPRLAPGLDWQQAHAKAKAAWRISARERGFEIEAEDSLWYRPASGAYLYRTRTSLDLRDRGGGSDLWLDGNTGEVLREQLPRAGLSGDVVGNWLRALHTATIFGLAYQIFAALLGITVTMLCITGVVIWWKKRKARRRAC